MQYRSRGCRPLLLLLAVLLFPNVPWAGPIRIGSVSTQPVDDVKSYLPFAGYLAEQLQSEGIDRGSVVVARSISQMATFVRERAVDLYVDSPFPALAVSRLSGSKFLLRRWKNGIGEYHTVIFARKDSGINRLEDLRGKMIALREPDSSSAYFVARMAMTEAGLRLAPKKAPADSVGSGEAGYVLSRDDETTMVWVLRGKVSAGAQSNERYATLAKAGIHALKIIHATFSLPRHVVTYRADLPAPLVRRVKEVLVRMHQSDEGKRVLQAFERTTKFDDMPAGAMSPLLKFHELIDAELAHR